MNVNVFIDGGAGTTGLEIRERLSGRSDVTLVTLDEAVRKNSTARKQALNDADFVILCLPDDAAREAVAMITSDKTRVIDASTAHRVAEGWTYGFAEMDKGQAAAIAKSRRIGNPGCWPQGAIATLRPLVEAGIVPAGHPLTVHGISGYTGGGRTMIADYEAAGEDGNEFMPYGLTFKHKHIPELQRYAKLDRTPLFTPAVGNFAQGMITMVPLQLWTLPKIPTGVELHAAIADHFAAIKGGFVDVAPLAEAERTPELNPERFNNTNSMRLHVFANDDKAQAVLVAVYDNLGKGASGAAVQNLNLMLGIEARTSLAA